MAKVLYLVEVRSGETRFRIGQSLAPDGGEEWVEAQYDKLKSVVLDPDSDHVEVICVDVKNECGVTVLLSSEMLRRDFYVIKLFQAD